MNTITEVLDELGIDHAGSGDSKHVSQQGWLGLRCPYCDNGRGNYGLGINLRTLGCSCWACGSHQLWQVLVDSSGKDKKEVIQLLAGRKLFRDTYKPVSCGKYTPP